MSDKPKPCPFCGAEATYTEITFCANFDDAGHHWLSLRDMPAEKIECNNLKCYVRPDMIRVNTGDAIQKWNTRTPSNKA